MQHELQRSCSERHYELHSCSERYRTSYELLVVGRTTGGWCDIIAFNHLLYYSDLASAGQTMIHDMADTTDMADSTLNDLIRSRLILIQLN